MATTENTFNGDGSNLGPFSFTFQWLETTDIKVSVDGVLKTAGTHYNLQALNYSTRSGGQVLFTAGNAPAAGTDNIRVYRETSDTALSASFVSGSAIRAQDLNENFLQSLYIAQETKTFAEDTDASAIATTANSALANSQQALATAQAAETTANGIAGTASSALSTANAANATAATANTNATNAVNTANSISGVANAALPKSGGTMTGLITFANGQTITGYLPSFTVTTTAISKTLANHERCTVTASGQTITLPASPQAGWEVTITTAGTFTDTIIARNSANIMSLAEDMTIDRGDVAVTLFYVDATRGWRII
jgi:hypothetical protein